MKTQTYLALALVAGLLGTSIVVRAENLGTVTAGAISGTTISGNTITGGTISGTTISSSTAEFGGTVELDSDGITLEAGTGSANWLKWDDGSLIQSASGAIGIIPNSILGLYSEGGDHLITFDTGANFAPQSSGQATLGNSVQEWGDSHINRVNLSNSIPIIFENGTFTGQARYLCVNSSGHMFASATGCV